MSNAESYIEDMGEAPGDTEPRAQVQLEQLMSSENIAEELPEGQLAKIAQEAIEGYGLDKGSMKDWLTRMQKGLDLAKLIKATKTYPFEHCANVAYPLVTTAALQFNAKAYPAIVPADAVVKAKVLGADPSGQKAAKGERVSDFMSYQLTCTVEEWEEDTDKLLTLLPIVGTAVRKVWFDPAQGRIRVRLLTTGAFIVNDKVRIISAAPRLTEELDLYPTEINERKLSGTFRRLEYSADDSSDPDAERRFIEQHRRIDLDGDGYAEPYIVTVHVASQTVARIVADFDVADITYEQVPGQIGYNPQTGQLERGPSTNGKVTSIRRGSYFIAYHMLPSLDGGFWGTGFGLLLGDISDTINSIINQMLDAGHMASRGGGFIGSEFRIKGGAQQFKPGEWRLAQAAGSAIRDSIVPLTFPGPDATLFQLLGMLVEAGKEVASIKDILMGETGGKVQTATTTMALIEQGMAQFTAAYKRIFRALRQEFKLIAKINADTVSAEEYNAFHDIVGQDGQPVQFDPKEEFDLSGMDIIPVADPGSVTKMQQLAKAQVLTEAAQSGMVDPAAASARLLEAAGIEDIEELTPKPNPQAQQMQMQMAMLQIQELQAKIEKLQAETMDIQRGKPGADPQAAQMQAHADIISAQAQADEAPLKAADTQASVRLKQAQTMAVLRKSDTEDARAQADIALKAQANARAERESWLSGVDRVAAAQRKDEELRIKARQSDTRGS